VSPSKTFPRFALLVTSLSFGLLAGCAGAQPQAPPSAPSGAAPATESPEIARKPEASRAEAPPGELACRATSPVDGTSELFLVWEEGAAKGVLRKVAPSGEKSAQKVRAERYDGMIVADDPHEKDLTVHAALVRPIKGKAHMRVGGADQPWSACE
jgi:hypothetical protein